MQVYEVLARTVYGRRKRAEVGVARLLIEGAFKAAFPLHDVRDHTICLALPWQCILFSVHEKMFYFKLLSNELFHTQYVQQKWKKNRHKAVIGSVIHIRATVRV